MKKIAIYFVILMSYVINLNAEGYKSYIYDTYIVAEPTINSPSLSILSGKGEVRIFSDGKIELINTNLDEAAKVFWDKIELAFPVFKQKIIDEYSKSMIANQLGSSGDTGLSIITIAPFGSCKKCGHTLYIMWKI